MGQVIIQKHTTMHPISLIGEEAGICYGADTSNQAKNYKRGLDCLNSNHGRTLEYPDVYMILKDYSARVIREWYTHIGGAPSRLQNSTRYINYQKGFDFVIPRDIEKNEEAKSIYVNTMKNISENLKQLEILNIKKEDSAMLLPLGMTTSIVCKHNLRNLIDMSHQRECTRAYWEYRQLFQDLKTALKNYSTEWEYVVDNYFMPKCELYGKCTEKQSCGRYKKMN